jgi:prokaryotic YEATS domain
MADIYDIEPKREDAPVRDISRENVKWLLDVLLVVPLWWLIAVSVAVVLSCLTVTRAAGGAYSAQFAVTTTAVALLAVAWLPAVIRILAAVFKQGRAFGVEISGAGLVGLLDRFARHEPSGTFLSTEPQESQETLDRSEPLLHEWDVESIPESAAEPGPTIDAPSWTRARDQIYEDNRNVFLVHQIRPSQRAGQKYDIFVFLAGAHGVKPSDIVDQADFFLGRFWGNSVFSVRNPGAGQTIGIRTSAYGTALCVCRVKFKNSDSEVILHRFLDFEMHWVFEAAEQELAP